MGKIKAIIFDFDGVIADSQKIWNKYINPNIFSKYKISTEGEYNFPQEFMGLIPINIARKIKEKYSKNIIPEDFRQEWFDEAYKYIDNFVRLNEGVIDFIKFAHAQNYILGIGSNNFKKIITESLEKNKIKHYFKEIISEGDVEKVKPNPDIYIQCAKKLKVKPKECLVIEDSFSGILAAKRAGMKVYAINDNQNYKHINDIKKIADKHFENFYQILEMFEDEKAS